MQKILNRKNTSIYKNVFFFAEPDTLHSLSDVEDSEDENVNRDSDDIRPVSTHFKDELTHLTSHCFKSELTQLITHSFKK